MSNVPDFIWEQVAHDVIATHLVRLKEKGFNVDADDVCWSGFGCQGDGASFTGWINPLAFITAYELVEEYPHWAFLASCNDEPLQLEIKRNHSRYSHEYTVQLHITLNRRPPADETMAAIFEANFDKAEFEDISLFETKAEKIVRDECRALYKALERAYDELAEEYEDAA